MPQGNPQAYMQPQQPQQVPGMPGQLSPEILALIQQVITAMPDKPAGNAPTRLPRNTVPSAARQPTEQEQLLNMLGGMMQQRQVGANMRSANAGVMGRMGGRLGGRPVGS